MCLLRTSHHSIPSACMHSCVPPLSPPHFPPPASYLLTRKDVFFTKSEFCQVISAMLHGKDARIKVDLPPPALWKVGPGVYVWWDGRVWWCECGCCIRLCILCPPCRWDEDPWLSASYSTASSVLCTCLCLFNWEYCCLLYSMCVLLTGVTGPVLLVCAPLCTHGVDLTAAKLWQALS